MSYEQEAVLAIDKLNCLVEGDYMSGYEIASLMPSELLEALEVGMYALGQESRPNTLIRGFSNNDGRDGWCDLDVLS